LFVEASCNHQLHNLTLARRQQIETPAKLAYFRSFHSRHAIGFQRLTDRSHEFVLSHRLGQEMNSAGFQSLHGHWDVPMAGEENDGQADTREIHLALQVQTVHARHVDIQDDAPGRLSRFARQKFASGREGTHGESPRFDQSRKPVPNRNIIVDQENSFVRGGLRARPTSFPSVTQSLF
jgi:hypothetical protein